MLIWFKQSLNLLLISSFQKTIFQQIGYELRTYGEVPFISSLCSGPSSHSAQFVASTPIRGTQG